VDKWSINGKSRPRTEPIRVRPNGLYRPLFDNRSDEAHPVHLRRHTSELTKVEGVATSSVYQDVVVVRPKTQIEADLIADNPGPSLFHCRQQMHMDFGFMASILSASSRKDVRRRRTPTFAETVPVQSGVRGVSGESA
jgi:FtsP/CotA-like multicopper oxidase with cupredoxin domain